MFFTTKFDSTVLWGNRSSGINTVMNSTLDVFTKTAIINGLSGLQSLAAVSASCDTGNCSFTTYGNVTHSTLGIESMCLDISPFLIQTDNFTLGNDSQSSVWQPSVWTNYTFTPGYPYITNKVEGDSSAIYGAASNWDPLFSLDGGMMNFSDRPSIKEYIGNPAGLSPEEEHVIKTSFYTTTFMIPTLSPCLERSAYPSTADFLPLTNTSSCPQLGMANVSTFPGYFSLAAVQCILYPSIRRYSGSIVNGQIQETLTGDPLTLNYGTNGTDLSILNVTSVNDLLYYAFLDPCIIEGTVYTSVNMSQVPGDRITIRGMKGIETTGPNLCLYGASQGFVWALSEVLHSFALQPVTDLDDPSGCIPNADYTNMKCSSMWWLEPLFNGGNTSFDSISAMMSRMADAITNQLRMNGTDWYGNPSNVTGTAFHTVVCTQVQWGWLLFPAGVLLASAVLLVATAWSSSSRWAKARNDRGGLQGLPVWKSSLLPLLFYGLEDGIRLKGAPVEDKEMVPLAKDTVARLSFEEDELRLHSAKPALRQ